MIYLSADQQHPTSSTPFTTQMPSKSPPTDSDKDDRHLSQGALAAIFITAILVAFACGFCLRKKCKCCGQERKGDIENGLDVQFHQNENGMCCSLVKIEKTLIISSSINIQL